LPFRFESLEADRVVVTNLVGEHLILDRTELESVVSGGVPTQSTLDALRSRHIIREPGEALPVELLASKLALRKRRLAELTALHMFVVSLRCEHTCRYCQVSRQASSSKGEFDMTEETAEAALRHVFSSPSHQIKIEFQGGEPLLNFDLVRWIVLRAEAINRVEDRDLAFVITTNLALIDDDILDFCAEHDIAISTSIDGPRDLHNHNRRRPGQNSWEVAVAGLKQAVDRLGAHKVSALMTTTEASLSQPEAIVDTYVDLGLRSVFFRPISPYGFATRLRGGGQYDTDNWLEFYRRGLAHVINLNRQGVPITEVYAAIAARKMFTNDDPGYVDLTSPAGIGIAGIVYNYDGDIYASDESRMLAEMGDHSFRLGTVHDDYKTIMMSDQLLGPLWESYTLSVPKCDLCAFEPWCGADPVFHHTTARDVVGHKTFSAFCKRNTGIFTHFLQLQGDDFTRDLLWKWAHQ
jgi:His-Xaa-Ser system radical SAM maturase HxsB